MILAGSDDKLNRPTIDNIESYFLSFQNCSGTKYIHFYIILANHTPPLRPKKIPKP